MKIFFIALTGLLVMSCSKESYEIDFQEGYPSKLAGNWLAFEFQGGSLEGTIAPRPYDMVTALDPNRDSALIIDRMYGADIRVRANYSDTSFSIRMSPNLELVSTNNYGVEYISAEGYITSNPVLINVLFQLASQYYENISFDRSYIEDLIFMRAGFYDAYRAQVDTVLILGYRKTGFEEVNP